MKKKLWASYIRIYDAVVFFALIFEVFNFLSGDHSWVAVKIFVYSFAILQCVFLERWLYKDPYISRKFWGGFFVANIGFFIFVVICGIYQIVLSINQEGFYESILPATIWFFMLVFFYFQLYVNYRYVFSGDVLWSEGDPA